MSFGRITLWIVGALFIVFGIGYLFYPTMLAGMAEISATAPGAATDVRATYGGFQIGFGAFLIWSALTPNRMPAALFSLALVVGGVGACRLIGIALDGSLNSFHMMGLAFEIPITAIALLGLTRVRAELPPAMAT